LLKLKKQGVSGAGLLALDKMKQIEKKELLNSGFNKANCE
jgi:hypothetical protein